MVLIPENLRVKLRKFLPLFNISIEPTNDCNLDCWFCYRKDRPVGYMDIEKYKILIDELPITCRFVTLSFAGEGALHPKIGEFIKIANQHGYTPKIYTNGTQKYPSGAILLEYPKPPKMIFTNKFTFMEKINITPVYKSCPQIYSTTNVLWNGDVVPCCCDLGGKHIMGNVFKDGLLSVLANEKYKKLRKDMKCDGCELYKYHFGELDTDYKILKSGY